MTGPLSEGGDGGGAHRVAGFTMREIGETLAWEEQPVEKIIRRYVGRSALIKAMREKLKVAKE
jgi:hypothetical protein